MTGTNKTVKEYFPGLWSLLSALVIITVCSRSSFLYAFNLWDDANSYFTVGKCIFRGFVPYRDLFDQKGPMLYFIYGFASLISPTTFIGVYIAEVIAAAASLLAIYRIYRLFLKTDVMPFVATPITGAVIYSSWNFWWGGSAEEFLFPFIMWGMYLSLDHFRNRYPKAMDYKTVLIGGLLAGCVFNLKFSSLGFFFGWMAFVFFADIVGGKALKKAIASCFVFLGGMGIATIPWILYFGVNGAIYDWLHVYIYKNVFEYSKSLPMGERVAVITDILKNHVLNNELAYFFIAVGVIYFIAAAIFTKRVTVAELLNLGMLSFFLVFVLFIGAVSLPYYSFPVNGFVLFGFIPFCYIIEGLISKKAGYVITAVSLIASFLISWLLSVNVRSMYLEPEDMFVYKFRDYIRDSGVQDPGIIVQFTFDVGLYTVLDEEPICYYFQTQTLNMEEVLEYQEQYLYSGEADFVVTCDHEAEGIDDRYDLVMEEPLTFDYFDHVYRLYQRNSNPATK
ncbi:MAG: hypothetical protein E7305_11230 [Butyrivibrio sp.]|nr:hypothetical protein [Butyrivibrio sp.]